jgi:hypothetical protein
MIKFIIFFIILLIIIQDQIKVINLNSDIKKKNSVKIRICKKKKNK